MSELRDLEETQVVVANTVQTPNNGTQMMQIVNVYNNKINRNIIDRRVRICVAI